MNIVSKNLENKSSRRPFVLVILDGFGYADKNKDNAIAHAHTPHITQWLKKYPHALLKASGTAVGLPAGYIGNSEVGHLTIGAGRIIEQPLTIINKALEDGSFFCNSVLREKLTQFASISIKNSVHIMGLLSDAGVHSHEKHLYGYIKAALQCGVHNIVIHAFLDGRDVPPRSAEIYLARLEQYIAAVQAELGTHAHIILGSVMGRFYAMDRDNNGERTAQAYQVLTSSPATTKTLERTLRAKPDEAASEDRRTEEGSAWQRSGLFGVVRNWRDVLQEQYERGISDEYVEPTNLDPAGIIKPGDGIIFFNFRPDRARQLTRAFIDQDSICLKHQSTVSAAGSTKTSQAKSDFAFSTARSEGLPLSVRPECSRSECIEGCPPTLAFFITPVSYFYNTDPDLGDSKITVLFPQQPIPDTLKEIISRAGRTIFSIAETEKYAHVTYFFSGYREQPFPGETPYLVPSLHLESFAKSPEMSAPEITQAVLASLEHDPRDFYLINYANADMVGHTGDFQATVKAIECLDSQVAQLCAEILDKDGVLWITADHGKAEDMFDEKSGQLRTAHTANLVLLIEISRDCLHSCSGSNTGSCSCKNLKLKLHELADIAPHILSVMGIGVPDVMKKRDAK
jgi:2,3-bisphosphoglycerate-independent phosphoglycerate mutase